MSDILSGGAGGFVQVGSRPCLFEFSQPAAYVPSRGEIGADINGVFRPIEVAVPPGDTAQDRAEPRAAISYTLPDTYPAKSEVPAWTFGRISAPELRNGSTVAYILDRPTDADATPEQLADPNYVSYSGTNVEFLSPTHFLFPAPTDSASLPEAVYYNRNSFRWGATATWTKTGEATGTLALAADGDYDIYYSTAGAPATTAYSAPIEITATTTVTFRLRCKTGDPELGFRKAPSDYVITITFPAGVAPDSFAQTFPVLGFAGDDSASTIPLGVGEDEFNGIAYIYTLDGSTPTPTTRTAAKNGIRYTGPLMLDIGDVPATTTLKVVPFRYGLPLPSATQFMLYPQVGIVTFAWDGTDELTISSNVATPYTVVVSIDGVAQADAPGPRTLTITESKTVAATIYKSGHYQSPQWTRTIDGATPEEAFTENYWTPNPNDTQDPSDAGRQYLNFMNRRPTYYISPSGTGTGLTAADPSNWETVLGYTWELGSAVAGDVVWASEGTYTLGTTTDTDAFYSPGYVTVFGGFNSTFTERDVTGRPSILTNQAWNSGTEIHTSITQVYHLDGFTIKPKYSEYQSDSIYMSEVHGYTFNACTYYINESFTAGSPAAEVVTIVADAGYFYNGTIYVNLVAYTSTANSITREGIALAFDWGYMHNCVEEYYIDAGKGCDGIATKVSGGDRLVWLEARGTRSQCTVTAEAESSGGGDAHPDADNESGGFCHVTVAIGGAPEYATVFDWTKTANGGIANDCTINVTCSAGDGGKYGSYRPGAREESAAAIVLPVGMRNEITAEAVSGDGQSSNATVSAIKYWGGYIPINSTYDISAVCGDQYSYGPGQYEINPGDWGSHVTFSPGIDCSWSISTTGGSGSDHNMGAVVDSPTHQVAHFDYLADDVSITENPLDDADGNPIRPNATGSGAGWYGGTPNGDGAPIDGFETAQGTGTQLGRYWE